MPSEQGKGFEAVLEAVGGGRGRYQRRLLCLVCFPAAVVSTFLIFSHVFASASPDHWCASRPNGSRTTGNGGSWSSQEVNSHRLPLSDSRELSKCYEPGHDGESGQEIPCRWGWEFNQTLYDSTLVTEFELVCDSSWLLSVSTSLFYVGSLLGNAFFGWASDRWGRRRVFYPVLASELLLSTLTPFAPSFLVYNLIRTIRGLFFPAIFQLAFIIGVELTGNKERAGISCAMSTVTAVSAGLLAFLAMATRDWRKLCLCTSIPLLPLLGIYWVIPESPRWLLTKRRLEEAEEIVQRIASVNGEIIPQDFLKTMQVDVRPAEECKSSPWDLVLEPTVRRRYLVILLNWVTAGIAYHSLSYYTTRLGINDYLAFFSNAIIEVPSYLTMGWFMDKYGRRLSLSLSMLLGGVACLSTLLFGEDSVKGRVGAALLGKLGTSAAFAIFYVFVAELFPTTLRAQAMGIGSFVSGLALLGFPFMVGLADKMRSLPLIIIGVLSTTSGLLALTLPETKEYSLPQFADEVQALSRGSSSTKDALGEKTIPSH